MKEELCLLGMLGLLGAAFYGAGKISRREDLINRKRKYMAQIDNVLKTKRLAGLKGLDQNDKETLNQTLKALKTSVNAIDKELGNTLTYSDVDYSF